MKQNELQNNTTEIFRLTVVTEPQVSVVEQNNDLADLEPNGEVNGGGIAVPNLLASRRSANSAS